jgi:hypothetical protein
MAKLARLVLGVIIEEVIKGPGDLATGKGVRAVFRILN